MMTGQIKSIQFQTQSEAFEAAQDLGYKRLHRGSDTVSLSMAILTRATCTDPEFIVPTRIEFGPDDQAELVIGETMPSRYTLAR
jgi:hypothetical protein